MLRLTFALLLLAGAVAAQEKRAGAVEAIQQDGRQSRSGVGLRLSRGEPVYRAARLYTKEYGTIETRFADGALLTVAPRSQVYIDDFVLAEEAPSLAIRLARGAARIVSGRLPKDAYLITTPGATIGVRGASFWLDVDLETTRVWVDKDAVTITAYADGEPLLIAAPAYADCAAACLLAPRPPEPGLYPLDPRITRGEAGAADSSSPGVDVGTDPAPQM